MKKYLASEGSTGVLYIQKLDINKKFIYQPNCDMDETRKWLYEFYELKTHGGVLVKNAFVIDGIDWFPSAISELTWQFFYQFIKYKNLIEEIKIQEVDFIPTGGGRFIGFLSNIGLLRESKFYCRPLRLIARNILNRLIILRNKLIIHITPSTILFLRNTADDFRSAELVSQLQEEFDVIQMLPLTSKTIVRYFFNRSICFRPFACNSIRQPIQIELQTTQHWIHAAALEFVKTKIDKQLNYMASLKHYFSANSYAAFISMDDCNYTFPYIYSAQNVGITTIGIQHGLYSRYHEAYTMRGIDNYRWFDCLIVWGAYWKKIFLENNKKYTIKDIFISTNKHSYNYSKVEGFHKFGSKSILIPYEFLTDTILIGKFIQHLVDDGFTIYFKIRPDENTVDQIKSYHLNESTVAKLRLVQTITPELMERIDVVAGSYSSVIYDTLPYNKIIWVFETPFRFLDDLIDKGFARQVSFDDLKNIVEIYNSDISDRKNINPSYFFGNAKISDVVRQILVK